MPPTKLRVILDTNIWISRLLDPKESVGDFLRPFLTTGQFVLLFSRQLIDEIALVAERDFSDRLDPDDIRALFPTLQRAKWAERVRIRSVVAVCRDPKDNYLLAMAKDGRADFLVARDRDLLSLGAPRKPARFGRTHIITLGEWRKLQQAFADADG